MERWIREQNKNVPYTIISTPVSIDFWCNECDDYVTLPFKEEYWESGCTVECPVCGTKILLGDWEYD